MLTIAPGEVYPPAESLRLLARLISVRAGLQIIRYVSAKDVEAPPIVLIQAMPEDCEHVTLLSSKDSAGFSLDAPGDVIVVKAMRDVKLVATTASLTLCADAVVLRIERIGGREALSGPVVSTATVELIQPAQRISRSAEVEPDAAALRGGNNIDARLPGVPAALSR